MQAEPRAGYVAFVLHAHMPYVLGHGRWPHGVDWLNEAVAETYLPLLGALTRLGEQGVLPRVTIGTSPVLLDQLADPRFVEEFDLYLKTKIEAAAANAAEFAGRHETHFARLADGWRSFYEGVRRDYHERYRRDLVGAFRSLQDRGAIETMTCAATHGYLPLLREEGCIRAQIRLARKVYERHYGRRPRGIWLPECAYRPRGAWVDPLHPAEGSLGERPGLEEYLADEGIEYFIVDTHLLRGGEGRAALYLDRYRALRDLYDRNRFTAAANPDVGESTIHRAYLTSSHPFFEKTVAFFTRDAKAALQVWSGEFGYPGNPQFLDFHKKHWPGGLRYWRVTDFRADLGAKQPYEPDEVARHLDEQARHYAGLLRDLLASDPARGRSGEPGVVCVPFDAELFGHWWFEGIPFLERLMRLLAGSAEVQPTTCSAELDRRRPTKLVRLAEGSWGKGGHHWIWLNDDTRWTWELVHDAEMRMGALVAAYGLREGPMLRALLAQAGRELLLAEASDWQFIISARDAGDYAAERLRRHVADFNRLAQMADKVGQGIALTPEEAAVLSECQARDALFSEAEAALWL